VKALSKVFRGKFVAALAAEQTSGKLRDDTNFTQTDWQRLKAQLGGDLK